MTELSYANQEDNLVWCIGEIAEVNNETGERHQTKTFRFICLGERGKDHQAADHWTYSKGVNEDELKILRCDAFAFLATMACTNVLVYRDEFLFQMTPQFIPNTAQGLDLKQDQHWRVLTLIVDSETDLLDAYMTITTKLDCLPTNFYAEFTLADGLGTTELWTYTAPSCRSYVLNRREGEIHADVPRDTFEYQILTLCNKTVTHP